MIPDDVKKEFEEALKKKDHKVWAGVNQTIRKVYEKSAKIVLIAEDTEPKELVTPLAQEAKTKKIPYYFGTKAEIAKLTNCPRPAAAGCLIR